MLFNSIAYLIFLPLAVAGYYLLPQRQRWLFLLLASYLFYAFYRVEYTALLMASTAVSYYAGLAMGAATEKRKRRPWLIAAVAANLFLLFVFKYLGFFTAAINQIASFAGSPGLLPVVSVLLPVGISFYTFQTIGYLADVYRGVSPPERHAGIFALYVSFFPQLVAGPIERARNLMPQFREAHPFDPALMTSGLRLMLWGFFKKIVIADRLVMFVQPVFSQPDMHSGISIALALPLLMLQVYADFSGYTDIAIGSARLMGFRLSSNFRQPFSATSVSDFWSRWHITLTTWLRDYVYFSLPSRFRGTVSGIRMNLNLVFTFMLVGFWHGAHWNFLIFGLLHGLMMALANITKSAMQNFNEISRLRRIPRFLRALNIALTFLLVSASALFFGQHSLSDSLTLMRNLADFSQTSSILRMLTANNDFILGMLLIGFMLTFESVTSRGKVKEWFLTRHTGIRFAFYLGMLFFMLIFGIFSRQEFFYFQF